MNHAIEVKGLTKSYGSNAVLKGLDFQVRQGEIFALLGVNGAGKTTALECMEGLRNYDSGNIRIHGRVGIQLQSASLPSCIRPMEAVHLFAKWNHTSVDNTVLSNLGIQELAQKQYTELSTGQKRRLHLALALIGNPDLLFLDEPTAGLDVEGRISLHEEIRKLKANGKTIILASHDMAEVEELCDRIAILNAGKIVFVGSVPELQAQIGKQYTISIKTRHRNQNNKMGNKESENNKTENSKTENSKTENNKTKNKEAENEITENVETDNISDTLLTLLAQYKQKGITVLDIQIDRGTLEQHFIAMTRGNET